MVAPTTFVKIEILGKDISFFESLLGEEVLLRSEHDFDQGLIKPISTSNGNFELLFNNKEKVKITLKKDIINSVACTCNSEVVCEHIATALYQVRKSHFSQSKKKGERRGSNQNFLNKIDTVDLRNFVLTRMKADKYFKILIQARFLVENEGANSFEAFIDKAFPPSRTTTVSPSHKEYRLFKEVSEEVYDQIKDLIGGDNYVDALLILVPLIKKSFYFKKRFEEIPETFIKNHLHLVELLRTLQNLIEAPKLKNDNAEKIIDLLKLSYLIVDQKEEKRLFVDLIGINANKEKITEDSTLLGSHKAHNQFIRALRYVCQTNDKVESLDIGKTFIEIFEWNHWNSDFLIHLFKIAEEHSLPVRFIEKLLSLEIQNEELRNRQKEICIQAISKYNSFPLFLWLFQKDPKLWEEKRNTIIDRIKEKRGYNILIQILLQEGSNDDVFITFEEQSNSDLNFRFLSRCLDISFDKTLDIYRKWMDNYLNSHFGTTSFHLVEKELRKVGTISTKLKEKLEDYLQKMYGDRPSIK